MKTKIAIYATLAFITASTLLGAPKDQVELDALAAKYKAESKAIFLPKLEADKYYIIGGTNGPFSVLQVTDEVLFVMDFPNDKPWALLTFQDPSAVSGVQIKTNARGRAIGKFIKFATIPMADGSEQRFPLFECVGFLFDNDIAFISTEKK